MQYIKSERTYLTTFLNAEKRVEITTFKVFGNEVKHCLKYLMSFQWQLKKP